MDNGRDGSANGGGHNTLAGAGDNGDPMGVPQAVLEAPDSLPQSPAFAVPSELINLATPTNQ